MKKIISTILIAIFLWVNALWFIYAQDINIQQNINNTMNNAFDSLTPEQIAEWENEMAQEAMNICTEAWWMPNYDFQEYKCRCRIGGEEYPCENIPATETTNNTNNTGTCETVMGITCCGDQLINGQCKFNVYDTLGIRKSVRNPGDATSVGLFAQDIILSATFFIGTIVTVALVVSGIMYILAASSGKDPANAKNGIIWSLVGLLLVVSSYVIIRLVQYIAKGF